VQLSVLMPVFNEAPTLASAIERVLEVDYPCPIELVVVDDGSTDGSEKILSNCSDPRLVVREHARNLGKGAAIRTASNAAVGDYVIICDADLEYDPRDIPALLRPIVHDEARVVYGTRSFGSHTAYSFWYVAGNKAVTMAANVLFNSWISDLETCFKLLPLELYRDLDVQSAGFGMEAEITGKLLARGVRPFEVPINYRARGREEGKKLTWRDGVEALWILSRIRFASRSRRVAYAADRQH
jgi:dolichol-phosphate hexosyltransferase